MSINIPLPSADFGGGGNLLQALIGGAQAKYNRNHLAQQQEQFLKDYALRKQEQERLAELLPFEKMLKQAQMQQALGAAFKSSMLGQLYGGGDYGTTPNMYTPPYQAPYQAPSQAPSQAPYSAPEQSTPPPGMVENPYYVPPTEAPPAQVPITPEAQNEIDREIIEASTNPNYNKRASDAEYAKGQEVVINEGDPRKYGLDRIAGAPGFGNVQTHYDDNGNLIKIFPSGKVTMTRVGKTARQNAREKEAGTYAGKSYGEAVDAVGRLGELKSNLNRIADSLEKNPNADQVIGPINKYISQYSGTPQDKLFLGEIMTSSGNIVMASAGAFKGAFRQGEQSLITSMKANANDPYWVFIGKLKAMGELTDLAAKRESLYASFIEQDMPPHEAMKKAQELTDMLPLTQKFEKTLRIARARDDFNSGKMPILDSKEEADEFLKNLPPEMKIKFLVRMGK